MSDINTISKLSVKTMSCNPKRAAALNEGDKTVINLATIFGEVTSCKEKKRVSANGDVLFDYPLQGRFEGTNLETGEVFQSGMCYLPGGIHETVQEAINKEGVKSVRFGMLIAAQRAKNPAGYSYIAKNLVPFEESDPFEDLRKLANEKIAALPAPKQAAKK